MEQKAFSFDPETLRKIKKSFKIMVAGIILATGGVVGIELRDYLLANNPIDWGLILWTATSAMGAFLYNLALEWKEGKNE